VRTTDASPPRPLFRSPNAHGIDLSSAWRRARTRAAALGRLGGRPGRGASGYGCGRCEACRRFEPRACPKRGGTYGYTDVGRPPHLWGGYAERTRPSGHSVAFSLQDIEAFPVGRVADGAEVEMRFQATVRFGQRLSLTAAHPWSPAVGDPLQPAPSNPASDLRCPLLEGRMPGARLERVAARTRRATRRVKCPAPTASSHFATSSVSTSAGTIRRGTCATAAPAAGPASVAADRAEQSPAHSPIVLRSPGPRPRPSPDRARCPPREGGPRGSCRGQGRPRPPQTR
jgi:hypothetical protein